jgi:hypothetical protein
MAHDEAAGRKPVATEGAIKYRRLVLLHNESLASRHMPRQCRCSWTEKAPADQVFSSSYNAVRHQRFVSCYRASFTEAGSELEGRV